MSPQRSRSRLPLRLTVPPGDEPVLIVLCVWAAICTVAAIGRVLMALQQIGG